MKILDYLFVSKYFCKNCGKDRLSKFCSYCGNKCISGKDVKCNNCGEIILDYRKICGECGTKLEITRR